MAVQLKHQKRWYVIFESIESKWPYSNSGMQPIPELPSANHLWLWEANARAFDLQLVRLNMHTSGVQQNKKLQPNQSGATAATNIDPLSWISSSKPAETWSLLHTPFLLLLNIPAGIYVGFIYLQYMERLQYLQHLQHVYIYIVYTLVTISKRGLRYPTLLPFISPGAPGHQQSCSKPRGRWAQPFARRWALLHPWATKIKNRSIVQVTSGTSGNSVWQARGWYIATWL